MQFLLLVVKQWSVYILFLIESYKTLNIENLGICEKGHKTKSNTNKMKAFFVLDKM